MHSKEILLICVRELVIHSQQESSHIQSTDCQFNLVGVEFVMDCSKDILSLNAVVVLPWQAAKY